MIIAGAGLLELAGRATTEFPLLPRSARADERAHRSRGASEQPEAHNGGVAEDRGDVDEGPSPPADETSEAATPHLDTRTWAEKYAAVPGPHSPFYSPPPSSRALHWLVAMNVGLAAFFSVAILAAALQTDSAVMVVSLLFFWILYSWLRAYKLRALFKELARRRDGRSDPTGGQPSGVEEDPEAQEQQRRQRAAWQQVVQDVFPLLSNPSAFKRPFHKRNGWKD